MAQATLVSHPLGEKRMNTVRKITNELAIAGQPTFDELQQLLEEGYRTVVNLRSPTEMGFLEHEQQQAECLGLHYINIPILLINLNLEYMLPIIQQLSQPPRPMLIHCDNGIRSSIIALIQITVDQGMGVEDAFQKVANLGLLK
jgi:uncharacterized protein (TIGR01244 family)